MANTIAVVLISFLIKSEVNLRKLVILAKVAREHIKEAITSYFEEKVPRNRNIFAVIGAILLIKY